LPLYIYIFVDKDLVLCLSVLVEIAENSASKTAELFSRQPIPSKDTALWTLNPSRIKIKIT
jgi:hypothetical protein